MKLSKLLYLSKQHLPSIRCTRYEGKNSNGKDIGLTAIIIEIRKGNQVLWQKKRISYPPGCKFKANIDGHTSVKFPKIEKNS